MRPRWSFSAILNRTIPGADGFVAEELAENLLATDREDESHTWFSQAYAALERDSWLVANEPERLKRLAELARPK